MIATTIKQDYGFRTLHIPLKKLYFLVIRLEQLV